MKRGLPPDQNIFYFFSIVLWAMELSIPSKIFLLLKKKTEVLNSLID